MKVDFNNLRMQLADAYNILTDELNDSILKHTIYHTPEDLSGEVYGLITGDMLLGSEDIKKHMEYLRMLINAICCVYDEEKPEEVASIIEKVNQKGGLKRFNNTEE